MASSPPIILNADMFNSIKYMHVTYFDGFRLFPFRYIGYSYPIYQFLKNQNITLLGESGEKENKEGGGKGRGRNESGRHEGDSSNEDEDSFRLMYRLTKPMSATLGHISLHAFYHMNVAFADTLHAQMSHCSILNRVIYIYHAVSEALFWDAMATCFLPYLMCDGLFTIFSAICLAWIPRDLMSSRKVKKSAAYLCLICLPIMGVVCDGIADSLILQYTEKKFELCPRLGGYYPNYFNISSDLLRTFWYLIGIRSK